MSGKTSFGARVLFEDLFEDSAATSPHLRGLSVGYELNEFRYDHLADLLFTALPDFALSYSERKSYSEFDVMDKIRKAARVVYNTEKYRSRGEFGELFLHVLMRDYYNTVPAISKIYYKDGPNETVKGFDAVHVVVKDDALELWLGESKFYASISEAIRDVVAELQKHMMKDYLRQEFLFIGNKIDDSWPHAAKLRLLLDENTSLDRVFTCLRIPVLLTYESPVVRRFKRVDDHYRNELRTELQAHHAFFRSHSLPEMEIILFLIPLEEKRRLVERLHKKLEAWKAI